jgi:Holliday junction resolvase
VSKSQRTKGKEGEQELARELRGRFEALGYEVVRGGSLQQSQRNESHACPDLILREHGTQGGGLFWIECKRGRKVRIRDAIKQAMDESAGTGLFPMVMWRDDREPWHVSMRLDDFLDLLVEYLERKR